MDTWKSLPPDVQKVMDDLAVEQARWTGEYMDGHVQEAMAWAKETQKVEVIELAGAEKANWDKKLEPLTEKWIAEAKAKGLPADAILADIREMIAKHSR
jgi:TRAP-type C4-dicarboxylate transport system substrate-binding protein